MSYAHFRIDCQNISVSMTLPESTANAARPGYLHAWAGEFLEHVVGVSGRPYTVRRVPCYFDRQPEYESQRAAICAEMVAGDYGTIPGERFYAALAELDARYGVKVNRGYWSASDYLPTLESHIYLYAK